MTYLQLSSSVTLVIHNAWKLDFNLRLSSFEEHIRGTRNLVDFAAGSPLNEPPHITFTSSTSTVASYNVGIVPEIELDDPSVAARSGYGESKWVSERVSFLLSAPSPPFTYYSS